MAGQRLRIASAREAGGRHSVNACQTQMVSLVFSGEVRGGGMFGFEVLVKVGVRERPASEGGPYTFLTLRSRPVMSEGAASPRMPSMVGAMSRRAPPGASWRASFSVTQMKGTGLVVW